MGRIAAALHGYADDHGGRLPPAALCDEGGRPPHSWRVLILPYLGEQACYDEFRLDEPWDSPRNLALLSRMPAAYAPPSGLAFGVRAGPHTTFYQAFVGEGTASASPWDQNRYRDFPDGTSNTVLFVEAAEAVPWTYPFTGRGCHP